MSARDFTPLERAIAEDIYHRAPVGTGAFEKKRPFTADRPSRQMSRALLDARAGLRKLKLLGVLSDAELNWKPERRA